MPKVTQTKIGRVFLREIEPRKWRADWRDPITRQRVRRVLPVVDFKEAQKRAKEINEEIAEGRGFRGRLRGTTGHLIGDAVQEAVKHSNASRATRKDYWRRYAPFAAYIKANLAGVRAWGELNEAILENYIEACRRQTISHDTLRLRLFVLRMTSRYMSRTHGYRDIAAGIRIRRTAPPRSELTANEQILNPAQMRALLTWLKDNAPMVHCWAVLQGLAGARLYEAVYLTEADIDWTARTIKISENAAHRPKTRSSHRVIPASDAVLDTLKNWIAGLKVRHPHGFLFFPSKGISGRKNAKSDEAAAGSLTQWYASRLWRAALDDAAKDRKAKLTIPALFTPRKLRASFVTAMRSAGADFELLQRYIGHAPSSILAAHYEAVTLDRLRPIADLAQELATKTGAFADPKKAADDPAAKQAKMGS